MLKKIERLDYTQYRFHKIDFTIYGSRFDGLLYNAIVRTHHEYGLNVYKDYVRFFYDPDPLWRLSYLIVIPKNETN